MEIMDRMKDPELLRAMGLGDKLLGSLIVMLLGLSICLIVLFIIMMVTKLLRIMSSEKVTNGSGLDPARVRDAATPAALSEIDCEEVAAITAAIEEMEDRPVYIKNISPLPDREI